MTDDNLSNVAPTRFSTGPMDHQQRPEYGTDELAEIRTDLRAIARIVRRHLTDEFTVGSSIQRTQTGTQAQVTIEFPTGQTIAAGIPLEDAILDGDEGTFSGDQIDEFGRDIVASTVLQWSRVVDLQTDDGLPAAK
ncbi:MAG: DUF5811 family protein [Halobacteriales archaeon]|nr:DUF5811 family protein [Halobacteriales archaeon]